jgi:hypothetical protein
MKSIDERSEGFGQMMSIPLIAKGGDRWNM